GLAVDHVAFPVPRHRPVTGLRRPLADVHHAGDPAAPLALLAPRLAQRPPGPQVADELAAQRPAARSGNSRRSHALTCSGDQSSCSFCCTHARNSAQTASFAGFGRRARSSARNCAATARYGPRVRFRATPRLTVDAPRPSRRAISRTPSPCARPTATSSRSASDRYRPPPRAAGALPLTPPAPPSAPADAPTSPQQPPAMEPLRRSKESALLYFHENRNHARL